MCLILEELGFKVRWKHLSNFETKLLKVRHMSRPNIFNLGPLASILKLAFWSVCGLHITTHITVAWLTDWPTLILKVMYDSSAMSFQFFYTLALDCRPMHTKTCKDIFYGKKVESEAKHKVWSWHTSPERWKENYLRIRGCIKLSAVLSNRHSIANKDWILSNDVRHLQEDRFTDCRKGKYIHTYTCNLSL